MPFHPDTHGHPGGGDPDDDDPRDGIPWRFVGTIVLIAVVALIITAIDSCRIAIHVTQSGG